MKILFVSTSDVNKKRNGGELCTNRNYESFCKLTGKSNVDVINLMEHIPSGISNALTKRINYFKGFYEGLTGEKMTGILSNIHSYDVVFINTSTHGVIARYLRKNNYKGKIITFFHNVEYHIKLEKFKIQPWKLADVFVIRFNEKMACKYSDELIVLNSRDLEGLKRIYRVENATLIPISLEDRYDDIPDDQPNEKPVFLFTGNNWHANIHGISWFIDHVLDEVDIKLQITGHKMNKIEEKLKHRRIEFLGFVDSLEAVMKRADYVLLPIFLGSGMKVKTCEALMFGKNIIGTTESFQGYNVNPEKAGALCNTKEEFIEKINSFIAQMPPRFNKYNRDCFLSTYSFEATLDKFGKLID